MQSNRRQSKDTNSLSCIIKVELILIIEKLRETNKVSVPSISTKWYMKVDKRGVDQLKNRFRIEF
jgi:hypothetical protein